MKRTTHALIGATTIGLVLPVLVSGLASTATAARPSYTQQANMTIEKPGYQHQTSSQSLTVPEQGAATPYPSSVEVEGSGVVTDVNLYLYNINHPKAEDLDVLLVGPGGQQATVMSDVGGNYPISLHYLFLDDEAGRSMTTDQLQSQWFESFQPTNLDGIDEFATPAPAATGGSALSVFDGGPVRGSWSLYVVDDEGGLSSAEGTIGQWWLNIESASPADVYPSTIEVANELPSITDVDVTLHGLTDPYPGLLDIMLVGPTGRQVTLVSDVYSEQVTDLTITLDDEADANLPRSRWTAGSYRPTNYGWQTDFFPAPAPASRGGTALSAFDGTNPNGSWRLFVVASDDDDNCCYSHADAATLSGWSLSIDAQDPHDPVGLLSIDGGAATTGTTSVRLDLDATDPAPATGVKQMRFSNDGTTWSAWQSYAKSAAWQLTSGDGVKTVSTQFADGGGNISKPVSDAITLTVDAVAPAVQKANPAAGSKDVKRSASPKVRASEKLRGSGVNKRSVLLKQKGTSKTVKGKVDYKAGRRQIVFNPRDDLDPATKYVLIVKTTVTDKAGNRFDADPKKAGAQPLRIKFTTR